MILKTLSKINRFLEVAAKAGVAVMLAVNLCIVFAGVVFRYIFNAPLGWVYEIAIFLMMWSAFVGSAALASKKQHVALTFLVLRFPPGLQRWVNALMEAAVLVFLVIIIVAAGLMIHELSASRSAYLRIPMIWVYSSVPVGMGMVFLQVLESLLSKFLPGGETGPAAYQQ